jgi:putative phosphoesterase
MKHKNYKKILVMSDNHGDLKTMDTIIAKEKPDYTIHCGDYLIDKKLMKERFDFFVLGNNDMDTGDVELNVDIEGYKFRILHGHTLGMDIYFPKKLVKKLQVVDYDVLVHGHIHIPVLHQEGSKTLFCPGSTSFPRDNNGPTYGIIKIFKNEITFEHKRI